MNVHEIVTFIWGSGIGLILNDDDDDDTNDSRRFYVYLTTTNLRASDDHQLDYRSLLVIEKMLHPQMSYFL